MTPPTRAARERCNLVSNAVPNNHASSVVLPSRIDGVLGGMSLVGERERSIFEPT